VSVSDRDGLIARIKQSRRASAAAERPARTSSSPSQSDQLRALETRIAHLERMVEGLQDSVYRESERQGKLIAELEAQLQPSAISAALSKDARDRGL
jgi:hypothetical protein